MYSIRLSKQVKKYIESLPPKPARQIKDKLLLLIEYPYQNDSIQLKGFPYHRTDCGEYRIIYYLKTETVYIVLVGRRNDGDVYRRLSRLH